MIYPSAEEMQMVLDVSEIRTGVDFSEVDPVVWTAEEASQGALMARESECV
jgi:hypothetical protein